ncbi:MAG: DegT/DnrJ/EryC1/StrS family aminotransferase [Deltaproteobacteria bacterium]|jgi:dTDP-4-amino-4,6-dideoxygalactose transaminase|nr:DegT/DnrJ/EryC1/StrS family aminotransferase [Deltaproteobacteria bacterium]
MAKDKDGTPKKPEAKGRPKAKSAKTGPGRGLRPLPSFLGFAPPLVGEEELEGLADTLKSGWLTHGPKTELFEKAVADYVGTPAALALSSCTAALHLGLRVLGVGKGDIVVTSPLTFVSTAHAIVYTGASPCFCDIDPGSGNLDPMGVRSYIGDHCRIDKDGRPVRKADRARVKALLPIHYGGFPAELGAFMEICRTFGLDMLEDGAHALGASHQGSPIGSKALWGKQKGDSRSLAAFSFYATKNLATGEGGLLTGPEELLAKARVLSAYGISDARRIWGRYAPKGSWAYDVAELGFKNNFTDIQAALGLAQLARFEKMQRTRRKYAKIYTDTLSPLGDLVTLPKGREGDKPAWHLYPLRLNLKNLRIGRDEFILKLRELNIGSSVMFIPVHLFTYYAKLLKHPLGSFPKAEAFFESEVSLPMSPANPEGLVREAASLIYDLLLANAN